jgi:hypothetical protein
MKSGIFQLSERGRLRPHVDDRRHLDGPVGRIAGEPFAAPALAERAYADVDHPLRHVVSSPAHLCNAS